MKLRITRPAGKELVEAAEYYESKQSGLAGVFAKEFERTVQQIVDFPHAWLQYTKHTRRRRMDRFPYGILYRIRGS